MPAMPRIPTPIRSLALMFLCLVGCAGSGNKPPVFNPTPDRTFTVNVPGTIDLLAYDPDGDPLTFSYTLDPPALAAMGAAGAKPSIVPTIPGRAVFAWTPGIADAGMTDQLRYRLTFVVRDNDGAKAELTIALTVVNPGLGPTGLSFVEPPGAGAAVDLTRTACIDMMPVSVRADLVAEGEVELKLAEPVPAAANLYPPDNRKAKHLNWCPTAEQLDKSLTHTLVFEARRQGDDTPVTKRFIVRFKRNAGANCPGEAPRVMHTSSGELRGPLNYDIRATISDDVGFKSPPILSFSAEPLPVGQPVDTSSWQIVEFQSEGEDRYVASIPNLNLLDGERRTLHYVVTATDNDDPEGTGCDHSTESELFALDVVGGASADGQTYGVCASCVADVQCGGPEDHCVPLRGEHFCGRACDQARPCDAGQQCVQTESIDGERASQCVPADGNCGQLCLPDTLDLGGGNETPQAASPMSPGTQEGLSICDLDLDFLRLPIEPGQGITARIRFSNIRGDLDLAMQLPGDPNPFSYQSAAADSDYEEVYEPCAVDGGEALVRVSGYNGARNDYAVDLEVTPGDCNRICTDDAEDQGTGNDRIDDFTVVEQFPYERGDLMICGDDPDYFGFEARAGEIIRVSVAFEHSLGDLDLRLLRTGELLIGQSESYRDVELIEAQAPVDDIYVVAVFGATRSVQNGYILLIEKAEMLGCQTSLQCPQGAYCGGGQCVDARCERFGDCGAEASCVGPRAGLDPAAFGGFCAEYCRSSFECRAELGYACKRFEDFSTACHPAGPGRTGDRCSSHADCEGTDVCLDFVGGYCATAGCTPDDCAPDTVCTALPGGGEVYACLKACEGNGDCRGGYACRPTPEGPMACQP